MGAKQGAEERTSWGDSRCGVCFAGWPHTLMEHRFAMLPSEVVPGLWVYPVTGATVDAEVARRILAEVGPTGQCQPPCVYGEECEPAAHPDAAECAARGHHGLACSHGLRGPLPLARHGAEDGDGPRNAPVSQG